MSYRDKVIHVRCTKEIKDAVEALRPKLKRNCYSTVSDADIVERAIELLYEKEFVNTPGRC